MYEYKFFFTHVRSSQETLCHLHVFIIVKSDLPFRKSLHVFCMHNLQLRYLHQTVRTCIIDERHSIIYIDMYLP